MMDLTSFEATETLDAPGPSAEAAIGLEASVNRQNTAKNADRHVARLNEAFRVVSEGGSDPRQWMLQRRSVVKAEGEFWAPISFCQSRDGLLLAIREKCIDASVAYRRSRPGEVIRADYPGIDAEAISIIKSLPGRFPRRAAREGENGDVDSAE